VSDAIVLHPITFHACGCLCCSFTARLLRRTCCTFPGRAWPLGLVICYGMVGGWLMHQKQAHPLPSVTATCCLLLGR
jgi:hypothetical protein